jgi:hypothetical protein
MSLTKINKTVSDITSLSSALVLDTVADGVRSYIDTGLAGKSSTAHVHSQYAPVDSPAFTGSPTAFTPTTGNRSTRLATTQFVGDELSSALSTLLTISTADARYLKLTGGTTTGPVTLSADPVNNMHAATKQYVDNKFGAVTPDTIGNISVFVGYEMTVGTTYATSLNVFNQRILNGMNTNTAMGFAATGSWKCLSRGNFVAATIQGDGGVINGDYSVAFIQKVS